MQRKKSEIRKKAGPVIIAFLLILVASGVFLVQKFMPSRERMEPSEYFGELEQKEVAVVLQDHLTDKKGILEGDDLYLEYSLVRESLNSRFFWDEENQQMLFTTALETYEIPVDSADYTVDGEERQYGKTILLQRASGLYLSADFLQLYTNVQYTLERESSHVLIRNQWGMQLAAVVKKDAAVRYQGGIKSPILTDVHEGDTVYILDELENWFEVLTPDGYIGYVQSKRLEDVKEIEVTREFKEQEYSSISLGEKVNLIWHQIDNYDGNAYLEEDTSDMTGVNVISPTWYSVKDNAGEIDSLASEEYVEKAHAAGLQVWGLINNFSSDVDTVTLLFSTKARRKMVEYLVEDALRLGLEGINLDFEYIREETGSSYVQFARELSIACRKNKLILSIDVPVPMDFNYFYDYEELGTVADYVIMMGYDEHYVGSDAGSVASLSFEENGITGMLTNIPAEKIISGVPFYTRIWYTVTYSDGSTAVNSESIGMQTVENTLETYGLTPTWDDASGQYYVAWNTDDGVLCEIWIENEESLAKKARLVDQYQLGGIAAWRLGYERASIWKVLAENIGA